MYREYLKDIFNEIHAVDCHVTENEILCGALYLEPLIKCSPIRLADASGSLDVEIPSVLLNNKEAITTHNAKLKRYFKPKQN